MPQLKTTRSHGHVGFAPTPRLGSRRQPLKTIHIEYFMVHGVGSVFRQLSVGSICRLYGTGNRKSRITKHTKITHYHRIHGAGAGIYANMTGVY